MNENDSEKICGILNTMGYTHIDESRQCDILVINTCSVRENADDRFFGNLGSYKAVKAENPDMVIAVCGCMMQQPEIIDTIQKKYRFVDIIFGTHNIHEFADMLKTHFENRRPICQVLEDADTIEENIPITREFKHKALVTIMNGCDNFCSYCIVPYTRGREKSREKKAILSEINQLAQDGCKEIMLLGQNVNSYGKNLLEPCDFATLLHEVSLIEGIERIRFMTSNPKDLTDDVIDAIAEHDNICNNIHLPLQSGSDRILKLMNRHYTQEKYLSIIDKLRKRIPEITLSTDIIVGFPSESEEDFSETLKTVQKCRFDAAFTFIFSPRKGTKAADMQEIIPKEIIHERFDRLLALQYQIMLENSLQYQDKVVEVIVEGSSKTDKEMMSGRTKSNKLVNFSGKCQIGDTIDVQITKVATFHLEGEII